MQVCFKDRKGFSLIELMIIVVVVGILTALAIPRFMHTSGRAKKSEAKMILKQVYNLQLAFYSEFDRFVDAANTAALVASELSFDDPGTDARYDYAVNANGANFTAVATEIADADGDGISNEQLTMDQNGSEGGDWM